MPENSPLQETRWPHPKGELKEPARQYISIWLLDVQKGEYVSLCNVKGQSLEGSVTLTVQGTLPRQLGLTRVNFAKTCFR